MPMRSPAELLRRRRSRGWAGMDAVRLGRAAGEGARRWRMMVSEVAVDDDFWLSDGVRTTTARALPHFEGG